MINESIWSEFDNCPTVEEIAKNSVPIDFEGDPDWVASYMQMQAEQAEEDILKMQIGI